MWNVEKIYALCILICDQLDIKLTWADIDVCLRPVPASLQAGSGLESRHKVLHCSPQLSDVEKWLLHWTFECGFLATLGYVNHAPFVRSSNYTFGAAPEGSPFWDQNLQLAHELHNKKFRIIVRLCILLCWTSSI